MEKPAEAVYPIHDLIRLRWSPRAFSERRVEPDKLKSLWEGARWAASSFNEQPWSFIVATKDDPSEFERLLGCVKEGNQVWARKAPVLMVSVAKLDFEEDGSLNRHAFHDVGLAVGNLVLQATAMGLAVHQMAGFDPGKVRERYEVPDRCEPVAALAIGYPGDPNDLPDKLKERELSKRSRKPQASFVFSERWGKVSPLLAS